MSIGGINTNILDSFLQPGIGIEKLLNASFFAAQNISNFETLRPDLQGLFSLNNSIFGAPTGNVPSLGPAPAPPAAALPGNFDKTDPFHNNVRNHYRSVLGREPEQGGFDHWVNARKTGGLSEQDMTKAFFNSEEFKGLNLSPEEKISRVYRTVLNREPEAAGLQHWVGQLNSGKSMDQIVDGFFASPERKNLETTVLKVFADNGGKMPPNAQPGILSGNPIQGGGPTAPAPAAPAAPAPAGTDFTSLIFGTGIPSFTPLANPLAGLFSTGIAPTVPKLNGLGDFLTAQTMAGLNTQQQLANTFVFSNQLTGGFLPQFNPINILQGAGFRL